MDKRETNREGESGETRGEIMRCNIDRTAYPSEGTEAHEVIRSRSVVQYMSASGGAVTYSLLFTTHWAHAARLKNTEDSAVQIWACPTSLQIAGDVLSCPNGVSTCLNTQTKTPKSEASSRQDTGRLSTDATS